MSPWRMQRHVPMSALGRYGVGSLKADCRPTEWDHVWFDSIPRAWIN